MSREEPIFVSDADEAEWRDYDEIKVEQGMELVPQSKRAAEWVERNTNSPMTMFDTPVPYSFWLGVAEIIKEQMRKTLTDELRHSRGWAYFFCMHHWKNKQNGLRPAHEQWAFADMLRATDPHMRVDGHAVQCLREAIYKFMHEEYLGRQVG